jgi:hypothetical protein
LNNLLHIIFYSYFDLDRLHNIKQSSARKINYAAAADCSTVVDWEDKLVLVLPVTV